MTKEKENTYLIETHSEHLILNLLQLIKDGSLSHEWMFMLQLKIMKDLIFIKWK